MALRLGELLESCLVEVQILMTRGISMDQFLSGGCQLTTNPIL